MSDVKSQIFTSTYDRANRLTSVVGTAGYGYDRDRLRMGQTIGRGSSATSDPDPTRDWVNRDSG